MTIADKARAKGYPMVMGYFRSTLLNTIGFDAYRRIQRGQRCKLPTLH